MADCRRCNLWLSNDTQYCEGCGLYHWRDECIDPYFNDPDNWCNCTRIFNNETTQEDYRNDRPEEDYARRAPIHPRRRR